MNYIKAVLVVIMLGAVGCKGPIGQRGEVGPSGPGVSFTLQGNVLSDDFYVSDSRISPDVGIIVYIGDASGAYSPIPVYSPAVSNNIFCLIYYGRVEIVNAYKYGMKTYRVIVITKTSAPAVGSIAPKLF